MPLHKVSALADEAVTLSLDVTNQGKVSGIVVANAWVWPVAIQVGTGMPLAVVWERTLQPGETFTQNLPNNRRFDWDGDLATWGVHMTPDYAR